MPATLADIQAKYGNGTLPMYKGYEPYMESETGHGYKGVVLYDTKKDLLVCNECGKSFSDLGSHLWGKHRIKANDYKEKNGLYKKTPLISKAISSQRSEVAKQNILQKKWSVSNALFARPPSPNKRSKPKIHSQHKMQFKNSVNLCPDQVQDRINVIKIQKGGFEVTSADIRRFDKNLYNWIFQNYGSISSGCEKLGVKLTGSGGYVEDHILIVDLRNWVVKHKKVPSPQDLNGSGRSYGTYVTHFGSWRRAKTMAGLDQLLHDIQNNPHKGIPAHLIVGGGPNE